MTEKAKKTEQVQYLTPKQLRDKANAPRVSFSRDSAWPGDSCTADRWYSANFTTVWVDHPTMGISLTVKRKQVGR